MCKKSDKEGSAWLSQDLLIRLKAKKEMHRQRDKGQASWKENEYAASLSTNGVWKAKARLELNLARM